MTEDQQPWDRVGKELIQRRVALGYPKRSDWWRHLDVAPNRTIEDMENGRRTNYNASTIALVERLYEWKPGSIQELLYGGEPKPTSPYERNVSLAAGMTSTSTMHLNAPAGAVTVEADSPIASITAALDRVVSDISTPEQARSAIQLLRAIWEALEEGQQRSAEVIANLRADIATRLDELRAREAVHRQANEQLSWVIEGLRRLERLGEGDLTAEEIDQINAERAAWHDRQPDPAELREARQDFELAARRGHNLGRQMREDWDAEAEAPDVIPDIDDPA